MATSTARHSNRGITRRRLLRAAGRVTATGLAAPLIGRFSAALAAYPDRPIKFIVPFGPGGPVDVVARVIAEPVAEQLGATVYIENRPGASGNLGIGVAARSDPDGYSVLIIASSLVINPMLFAKVPYDVEKDFLPLVDLADTPTGFACGLSLGVKTLGEFIALAKGNTRLSYSHPGFGTVSHLTAEYFKNISGVEMAAVPHSGSGPAAQSALSGAVEFCSAGLPAVQPYISAGTLAGLGVTSARRWFDLPHVPTLVESGFPDFVLGNFTAMLVPAKTPPEIAERLTTATLAALQKPELRTKLRTAGLEATAGGPDALTARIAREIPLWRKISGIAGVRPA